MSETERVVADHGDHVIRKHEPVWPDGGSTPPGVGFVEDPGSVHKKHECPPDRVEMVARLEEITARYNQRLENQRQVIENLSADRKRLAERIETLTKVLESIEPKHTADATLVQAVLVEEW